MTIHDQTEHEEPGLRHPSAVRPEAAADGGQSAGPSGDPILASKITAPDVPAWTVPRPRITELIALGTRWCPLTVITGPPGAGKTMALALWAAAEPGTVAWVNVDEYDNRPGFGGRPQCQRHRLAGAWGAGANGERTPSRAAGDQLGDPGALHRPGRNSRRRDLRPQDRIRRGTC